ncbi:MAG: lysylphosphatidylglycerol synthase transmembrane domain-containing protein [Candidatus Thorarchaeota archaeon]
MAEGEETMSVRASDQETGAGEHAGRMLTLRRLALVAALAIVVYLVLALYAKIEDVLSALSTVPMWILPTMMVLSFTNYLIRFGKWQYFLGKVGVSIRPSDSFKVFLAGFTLTATPGKMGEMVKGIFCKDLTGAPIAKTSPIVLSERLTDMLALVVLAAVGYIGGLSQGNELVLMAIVGALVLLAAIVLGKREFYQKIVRRLVKSRGLNRFSDSCDHVEDTMVRTLTPRSLIWTTGISIPGWFVECVELWLLLSVLTGLGTPSLSSESLVLLAQATFVHAGASVVGAVLVFLPGGLGGYEGFAQAVLERVLGIARASAFAAVLIIRSVTLWFSVAVGFVALSMLPRKTCTPAQKTQQD